ncbi:MerR family DNA-binding transcriptional regulator [Microcoleus sp. T2B6]|uniref:MerR family DNA-binding transcriptional regulator n=1 Tax=Microcoleus sp. T2B6 TaxID=3055424 RepID=UPI004040AF09
MCGVPFCLSSRVFAKKLGLSVKTLQRWDVSGKLQALRTLSGHRFYTEDDLLIANGLKPREANRKTVVYRPCFVQWTEAGTQKSDAGNGSFLPLSRINSR